MYILDRAAIEDTLAHLVVGPLEIVRDAYDAFYNGEAIVPPSAFLRFGADSPNRIIALPSSLVGRISGVKWISSYPKNISLGLERATAVIVLNDYGSGVPIALLEGAAISAVRTAASATYAAGLIAVSKEASDVVAIGCGRIAAATLKALNSDGWRLGRLGLYDILPERAQQFADQCSCLADSIYFASDPNEALTNADLIIIATTASAPWINRSLRFRENATVLHLSLRDLPPEIIERSINITDDR